MEKALKPLKYKLHQMLYLRNNALQDIYSRKIKTKVKRKIMYPIKPEVRYMETLKSIYRNKIFERTAQITIPYWGSLESGDYTTLVEWEDEEWGDETLSQNHNGVSVKIFLYK